MPESLPAATSLRADKRMVPNPSGRGPANRTCRSALECCQQLRQTPAAQAVAESRKVRAGGSATGHRAIFPGGQLPQRGLAATKLIHFAGTS